MNADTVLIKPRTIITMDPARRIISGGAILIRGNLITNVFSSEDLRDATTRGATVINAETLVAIPGFVQTHIHLCQTLFRGLADDLELLDWLKLKIFPFEASHTPSSMHASTLAGLAELIRSGTTTIMDMGSIHHEDEIVRAVDESGMRAFVGKAMMDINELYPPLKESTRESIESTFHQAEQWHGSAGGRIRYAVAPRFVLSCTDALLKDAYALTRSFPGMLFHTHAAENRHELEAVRSRCSMDNVEFFESIGVLHPNTCLAHCIWLNSREVDLLAQRKAKVLHCPSSNLKLGSGIARIPELMARKITVSLGADGAPCNNSLDAFQEMRLAATIQKPVHGPTAMNAETVFALATLGGATALGIDGEAGSIEPGKNADIVLLDLNRVWNPSTTSEHLYSSIVYSATPENVRSVMINGRWVFRDGAHLTLDEAAVARTARNELHSLLERMPSQ
jgi:5-methylthioadenosine/S-adenosylhomocysteine deaminase